MSDKTKAAYIGAFAVVIAALIGIIPALKDSCSPDSNSSKSIELNVENFKCDMSSVKPKQTVGCSVTINKKERSKELSTLDWSIYTKRDSSKPLVKGHINKSQINKLNNGEEITLHSGPKGLPIPKSTPPGKYRVFVKISHKGNEFISNFFVLEVIDQL